MEAVTPRLFDAADFAARIRAKIEADQTNARQVSFAIGVSTASMSRVLKGWPDLSHEHYLRLSRWLDGGQGEKRDAA